jgi:hypothetical protein
VRPCSLRRLRALGSGSSRTSTSPADYQSELLNAYGNFYDTLFARYNVKKNKLLFRHQGIVLFGQQVLAPGEHAEPFKPKQGC